MQFSKKCPPNYEPWTLLPSLKSWQSSIPDKHLFAEPACFPGIGRRPWNVHYWVWTPFLTGKHPQARSSGKNHSGLRKRTIFGPFNQSILACKTQLIFNHIRTNGRLELLPTRFSRQISSYEVEINYILNVFNVISPYYFSCIFFYSNLSMTSWFARLCIGAAHFWTLSFDDQ